MATEYEPFKNRHKFQDEVWGQIRLNDLERDIIDTPEFQRLFRTSQLGFVQLVYHTANHTRGAHSIGACRIADRLINRLVENTSDLDEKYGEVCPSLYANFKISASERILIRLGALLHDVSHVPLSHDLEKKSHKIFYPDDETVTIRSWYSHYQKHDDYEANPLLFKLIFDRGTSVLARVLRQYSQRFWSQLKEDATVPAHHHLKSFAEAVSKANDAEWKAEHDLLSQLLFHLLFYEKLDEAKAASRRIATEFDGDNRHDIWHLGPKSLSPDQVQEWHACWYQPFRHDIIGNTLSADLIDYLTRDPQRLGTQRRIDLHLLSYYALVNASPNGAPKLYRCAIDLHDHKRSTTRTFLLNDLFRLLDLRQDIHEKAVTHRVVQSAIAMLARGLLLMGSDGSPNVEDMRPSLKQLAGLDQRQCHSLQGEALFFNQLLNICENAKTAPQGMRRRLIEAQRIFQKLVERRVCRPLVIIPGNWVEEKLKLPMEEPLNSPDFYERTLGAIVDSAYYSPFLLFASATIEKYLEGVFDTDADVCTYAYKIAADEAPDALIQLALNVVPSRVITWTTPYKQLYKDPAAVVALEGCVGQIDELYRTRAVKDASTRKRIGSAIGDADSKYATLWQVYVFISDGLFYSGILNKLLNRLPQDVSQPNKRDSHPDRLRHSQEFLSLALKAMCEHWPGPHKQAGTIEDKKKLLESRMDRKAFKDVVRSWVGRYKADSAWTGPWLTVDIKQYYHECAIDESVDDTLKRPCRDIRYKFDTHAGKMWERAEASGDGDEYELLTFLKACGIEEPGLLSQAEFSLLVESYRDRETRAQCRSALATGSMQLALKMLWLRDFPWPEEVAKPVGEPKPAMEPELPADEKDIREWIQRELETYNVNRNVKTHVRKDIPRLATTLRDAASVYGRTTAAQDFRQRVQNESTLLWNDVRLGRAVDAVRRKWNLPPLREAETPSE